MKILVTGNAGFIGFHVFQRLQAAGHEVVGIDNLNNYYDVNLKLARLRQCGFDWEKIAYGRQVEAENGAGTFYQIDVADEASIHKLFSNHSFDAVCHLAAQAGVRYSVENPSVYISSNINGFLHILEGIRNSKTPKLVYASSSSIYGNNNKIPFSVDDNTDHPVSLYAATKKSNELMADCYTKLFDFKAIGLRFFTVYGPWGRPDMALFKFTKAILNDMPISLYNYGDMYRDFTYIDDIVDGIWEALFSEDVPGGEKKHEVFNLGNGNPVLLKDFIQKIEELTQRKAILKLMPLQPGDVYKTWADVSKAEKYLHYHPHRDLGTGIRNFLQWFIEYYQPMSEKNSRMI